jgi:hypothetical protein
VESFDIELYHGFTGTETGARQPEEEVYPQMTQMAQMKRKFLSALICDICG